MKAHFSISAALATSFFFAHVARADEPAVIVQNDQPASAPMPTPTPPPGNQVAPAPAPYERTTHGTNGEISEGDGPRPRVGFQMHIRTGYSIPLGNAANGLKMSDAFGGQVPVILDIGGKPIPNLFIGGYLGLGFGGCGAQVQSNTGCLSDSLTIGAEIMYSILPDSRFNPWIGYGIGLAASAIATNNESVGLGGVDFGHFMGGLDFRLTRGFGIGPFVDFGLGQYSSVNETVNNGPTVDGTVNGKALHEWLLLGAKFTIFP
jgi:hypothetical protein